ncbi:MAG TPA: G1 family glutamic endopeptidase [Rhodospirillales bacterium]|nr:G1 family glutamic endopeptidase [Rhodospirillales bacterium]
MNEPLGFHDLPPAGFDPRCAEPEVLARCGIPPKPDAPDLAAFWTEMFAPPLAFVGPKTALMAPAPRTVAHLRMAIARPRETSLNWSGAYITPRDGRQFIGVHGKWVVPAVKAPSPLPGIQEFRSSVWIGLDGQRRYFDSSLPQIGTAQFVNPTADPPYSVWVQWWHRDAPATHQPIILALPTKPKDVMLASMLVLNETRILFLIRNATTGQMHLPFTMEAPVVSGRQVKVTGATAEWVVERPTDPAGVLHELADYGEVEFSRCIAVAARMPPGMPPGPGVAQNLDGARLINMYKIEHNPSRTVIISRAAKARATPPALDGVRTRYTG